VLRAQEDTIVRERVVASIKVVEAHATLIEREAREKMFKMEVESTTSLAFVHEEASELV
jgi:hypothetical protein